MAARCFRTHRTKEETGSQHRDFSIPDPPHASTHLLELLLLHDACLLGCDDATWGETRSREAGEHRAHLTPESPARFSPPFLGPRFRAEAAAAAAAALLFAGFCA